MRKSTPQYPYLRPDRLPQPPQPSAEHRLDARVRGRRALLEQAAHPVLERQRLQSGAGGEPLVERGVDDRERRVMRLAPGDECEHVLDRILEGRRIPIEKRGVPVRDRSGIRAAAIGASRRDVRPILGEHPETEPSRLRDAAQHHVVAGGEEDVGVGLRERDPATPGADESSRGERSPDAVPRVPRLDQGRGRGGAVAAPHVVDHVHPQSIARWAAFPRPVRRIYG